MLDESVRRRLAQLAARGLEVRISDEGIGAEGPRFPSSAREVVQTLDELAQLARALEATAALARSPKRAPYR